MIFLIFFFDRYIFVPLIDFDGTFDNEVPIIISDEPEVKRIFRPGIVC